MPGLKMGNRWLSVRSGRFRQAYGVCSKVRGDIWNHHTLIDIDEKGVNLTRVERICDLYGEEDCIRYETSHGWHILGDVHYRFPRVVYNLLSASHVDRVFVAQSVKRGYFFLEVPRKELKRVGEWCMERGDWMWMVVERNAGT